MSTEGDILITAGVEFGIEIVNGAPTLTAGFETAAQLSLFGGNFSDDGSTATEAEQWWGNHTEAETALKYRSQTQHLLESLPVTTGNLLLIEQAVNADLEWFVDAGLAVSVAAVVTLPALDRVAIKISIVGHDGSVIELRFSANWSGAALQASSEGAAIAALIDSTPVPSLTRPPFTPSTVSVAFTETDQYLEAADAAVGIADVWSYSVWWKPANASAQAIFSIDPKSGLNKNLTQLSQRTDTFTGFEVRLVNSDATQFKRYIILLTPLVQWYNITVTWNGTDLLCYLDGVLQTVAGGTLEKDLEGTGTQSDDPARKITLTSETVQNPNGIGTMFSFALWDVALPPAAIVAIVNGGDAAPVDLNFLFGDYVFYSHLQQYYRLGFDSANIGKTYAAGLFSRDAVTIGGDVVDSDDIVSDIPT